VLRFAAMRIRATLVLLLACGLVGACNRNMEPFVPGEKPQQPDLSRIFPEGAEPEVSPGTPEAPGMAGGGAPSSASASAEPIAGVVQLAPELADRAPKAGILFVIVRRGQAGPPTAVKRFPAPSFPVRFSIGPEDRMIQTMPFEGPLQLTARLDADGNAMTREPGDLQGELPQPVSPGATGLTLTLDQVL